jgi:hypothetical protein
MARESLPILHDAMLTSFMQITANRLGSTPCASYATHLAVFTLLQGILRRISSRFRQPGYTGVGITPFFVLPQQG